MEASTKQSVTNRLLAVKTVSGKTYSQLAAETGLTNVYVAQLLRRQAQLKPDTVPKLREALPSLTDDLIDAMKSPPWRSYDPNLIQEPTVYRFFFFFSILNLPFANLLILVFFFFSISGFKIVFRLNEAVMHFGESIKEIINEDFGDGM